MILIFDKNLAIDKYERPILSLRISITNRCNVNCLYCHDGMMPLKRWNWPDEIYTICKIAKNIEVKKNRLFWWRTFN